MFAKTPDDALASVVKQIDKFVADNEGVNAVLNFSGELTDEYNEAIQDFAEENNIKNVALTTSADGARFKVNEDAELTVMAYNKKTVVYNFAGEKGDLNAKAGKAIVKGAGALLE